MENASRALVIAGGVLLSLIIIGVVMFAYRGITSLQKEKDISLSNEQVSKINEQIEKYTKKSVIYGSEVLSICNAIEDYSRKYPESEGYPKITAIIKIKADGKNDVELFFKDEYNDEQYNSTQRLKGDYDSAIETRDDKGKSSMSNGKSSPHKQPATKSNIRQAVNSNAQKTFSFQKIRQPRLLSKSCRRRKSIMSVSEHTKKSARRITIHRGPRLCL